TALLEREWARVTDRGFTLTAPGALLDDWRNFYDSRDGKRFAFYTTLHGEDLQKATRDALRMANQIGHRVMLSAFSAAEWLAPYARTSVVTLVAEDESALSPLRFKLKLEDASRGENVVVTVPRDPGVLKGAVYPASGVVCTSAVQTYLDLSSAGE